MERNKKGWSWPGTWKVVCDVCGIQHPSDQVKKRWDGLMVCEKDWEMRHPQTLYNYKNHTAVPTFVRPEPEDTFTFICTVDGGSAYAHLAQAGCAQAGNDTIPYSILIDLYTNGHE